MKKYLKFIIPSAIVVLIALIWFISYKSTHIASNKSTVVGNTAGNLYNGGLFCENNGTIYFSNPYDDNKLYSMKSDCSEVKKFSDNSAFGINSAGKYVYYVKNNSSRVDNTSVIFRGDAYGIVRCRIDGKHSETIITGFCDGLVLTGNTLVYNTMKNSKSVLRSVSTSGDDDTDIQDYSYNLASADDGQIIVSAQVGNHSVHSINSKTGASSLLLDENTYMASLIGDRLYYIDLNNDYALTYVNVKTNEKTVIAQEHCIFYNIYENVIYYQTEGETHALMMINTDGNNKKTIRIGDVSNVSCTSQYTFFQLVGSKTIYRIPTFSGDTIETFDISK